MCESSAALSSARARQNCEVTRARSILFFFPDCYFLSSPFVAPEVLSVQQRHGVHVMKSGKVTSSEAAVVSINPRAFVSSEVLSCSIQKLKFFSVRWTSEMKNYRRETKRISILRVQCLTGKMIFMTTISMH